MYFALAFFPALFALLGSQPFHKFIGVVAGCPHLVIDFRVECASLEVHLSAHYLVHFSRSVRFGDFGI